MVVGRLLVGVSALPLMVTGAYAQTVGAPAQSSIATLSAEQPQAGTLPDADRPGNGGVADPQTPADAIAPADAEAQATDDIVVTGSRLNTGFSAPTPVTTLGAEQLQLRAPTNVADVVNQIPSFRPTTGPTQSQRFSANSGTNNLDLRGLGFSRTLLLIDGRRQASSDTNIIPVSLVDRVEVVTGGASAAYGSDAVAGVANFILKKRIEGVQLSVQSGISHRGDDSEQVATLSAGGTMLDGRLRLVAGIDYAKGGGVGTIYTRDFGRAQTNLVAFGSAATRGSNPAQGFLPDVTYAAMTTGGVITSGPLRNTAFGPGGTPYAFQQGTVYSNLMSGGNNYGLNPSGNYPLKVPLERAVGLTRVEFEPSSALKIYAEGSFAHIKGDGFTSFLQVPSIIVSINNPYLPAATRTAAINAGINPNTGTLNVGRVFTDLGGYKILTDRRTVRAALGAEGALFGNFKWDAYYQYARTRNELLYDDNVVLGAFQQAAYAVRDASGQIVCGDIATNPNLNATLRGQIATYQRINPTPCAPFNIFGPNAGSPAAYDYITGGGLEDRAVQLDQLHVVAANISGSPFDTWAGPVSIAFGGEYRRQTLQANADPFSQAQIWASTSGPTYSGRLNVKEGYVEIGVPLARDVRFARALDLNMAGRVTDYSTSGRVETWKAGLTYEPVESLRLRATRSRDIRAPNLTELFQIGSTNVLANTVNPINNQTGVLQIVNSGNPDLVPEKADTLTGGVVFQPSWDWASGLRMSVDYYSIRVDGVVSTVATAEILRRCALGQAAFCNQLDFDNSTFGIARLRNQPINLAELKTQGLDIELSYRARTPFSLPGDLTLRALATHVFTLETTDTSGTVDRAGSLQQNGVPAWNVNTNVTYDQGSFSGTLVGRFFSASRYDASLRDPTEAGYDSTSPSSINDNKLPSRFYLDTQLRYRIAEDGQRSFQIFLNVDNILDKQPPYNGFLVNSGGNPYDLIGRVYRVGARMSF